MNGSEGVSAISEVDGDAGWIHTFIGLLYESLDTFSSHRVDVRCSSQRMSCVFKYSWFHELHGARTCNVFLRFLFGCVVGPSLSVCVRYP